LKLKLDENLGRSVAARLRDAGHDVDSVLDEGLGGASDAAVLAAATAEGRVLVTTDLDFSDPRSHPPATSSGIVVLRVARQAPVEYLAATDTLISHLADRSPTGELWVVRGHMIRVYGVTRG
jgi:predicted nuclease of predicted toxin-antitoxin system